MTFFDLHVGLPERYGLDTSGTGGDVSSYDWEQLLDAIGGEQQRSAAPGGSAQVTALERTGLDRYRPNR
jgi:hypothetical protein